METKFTPGPWNYKYDEQHDCFNIAGKENTVNDYVCRVENDFIAEYDAKLIASAPDMHYEMIQDAILFKTILPQLKELGMKSIANEIELRILLLDEVIKKATE